MLLEDKKIVLLKHHPMNVKFTNTWYTSQVEDNLNDYIVIDVTSRVMRDKAFLSNHPSFPKDVSPFFVGPITSSDEYWRWRKSWFDKEKVTDKSASRRPHSLLGYKDKDCLFSVYYANGVWERLSYVEARKKIYIPDYARYIVNTESYKWMKEQYDKGKKIALVDFDGYNYSYNKAKEKLYNSYINKCKVNHIVPTKSLKDYLALNSMKDVIDCAFTPAGHGFIIKMLLEGDLEVKDGQIIDHIGVLK